MALLFTRFVIVSPNAGRTGVWGGRVFVDGVHELMATSEDTQRIRRRLERFYGALPLELARVQHPQLFEEGGIYHGRFEDAGRRPVQPQQQGPGEGAPVDGQGDAQAPSGEERPGAEPEDGQERAEDPLGDDGSVTVDFALSAAIAKLDPEVDDHWTSNNLPALDVLEDLAGRKVSRAEVNAVADGYTRNAARKARADQ